MVFVLLVVVVTVIPRCDFSFGGYYHSRLKVQCLLPLYIICKLLLVLVTNGCVGIYDDDGKLSCCLW